MWHSYDTINREVSQLIVVVDSSTPVYNVGVNIKNVKNQQKNTRVIVQNKIARNSAERCNFVWLCMLYKYDVRVSVTGVYCDEKARARITRFSLKIAKYVNFYHAKFDDKIRRCLL